MDLKEARERIRAVDEEMAALFVRRMEAVEAVAAYKKERGLPIEDRAQEMRMLEDHGAWIARPELRPFYLQFLRDTVEVSKAWQHWLLGSEGR